MKAGPTIKQLHVLIIEDNRSDAHLIEREVRKVAASAKVSHASTFSELTLFLKKHSPDLILSDYRLGPQFSGLDALLLVKEIPGFIPFIFVTGALNDEELAAQTILAGASGYVLKHNISQLHLKLQPILEKVHKRKVMKKDREAILASLTDLMEKNGAIRHQLDEVKLFLENLT